jgi:hypothetical protein
MPVRLELFRLELGCSGYLPVHCVSVALSHLQLRHFRWKHASIVKEEHTKLYKEHLHAIIVHFVWQEHTSPLKDKQARRLAQNAHQELIKLEWLWCRKWIVGPAFQAHIKLGLALLFLRAA